MRTQTTIAAAVAWCAVAWTAAPGYAQDAGEPKAEGHEEHEHERPAGESPPGHVHEDHGDALYADRNAFIEKDYPEPFVFSLTSAWFDPWPHRHFNRRGAPFTHVFGLEPAFLDRDLFIDFRQIKGEDETEQEIEVEVEWAITRRIGLVIEAPFIFLNPDPGSREEGFGDMAVAARFLLVDTSRFLMSLNVEVEAPTGSEKRGLGSGETLISPTLSFWVDLGEWVAWNAQIGSEHGTKSGEDEVLYKMALTYSVLGPALFEEDHGDEHEHVGRHFPIGLINFIAEVSGKTSLSGRSRGETTADFTFGITYLLTVNIEIRAAVQFPLLKPREFDNGYLFSLVYHF